MKRWMLSGPNWNGNWDDGPEWYSEEELDERGYPVWVQHKGLRELIRITFDKLWKGFGADEYGNPSVYVQTGLFGIVFFYGRHVQTEVEVPELGENTWIDKVMYGEPE